MTDGLVTRWTVPLALHAGDPFSLMLLHSFTPSFKRGAALFSGERQSPGDRAGNEPVSAAPEPGAYHRLAASQARHDTREWQVKRRERTRHLVELGGLVLKAGLVELVTMIARSSWAC